MKAIGGALATGVYWFFAAAIVALFIEAFVDPNGEIVDVWVAALGDPAFGAGVIFYALLHVFERRRAFAEISLVRAALWGALSAPLLAALFAVLVIASGGWNEGAEPSRLMIFGTLGGMSLAFAIAGVVTVKMGRSMAAGIAGSEA
jgi:hypothetical protein